MAEEIIEVEVVPTPRNRGPEPLAYSTTGYPLPMVHDHAVYPEGEWNEDRRGSREWWPVPWINGDYGLKGDFHSFRDDMDRAETERLCCVCGDPLGLSILLGAISDRHETSGGWSHPKCLRLAVTMCPHFTRKTEEKTFGYLWVGDGIGLTGDANFAVDEVHPDVVPLTREDVNRLAAADPMGDTDLRLLLPVVS